MYYLHLSIAQISMLSEHGYISQKFELGSKTWHRAPKSPAAESKQGREPFRLQDQNRAAKYPKSAANYDITHDVIPIY